MNTLRRTVDCLRREALARAPRLFRAAQKRQEVLSQHGDLESVLRVLGDESESAYPMREALTRALLLELGITGNSVWSSALVLAYYPMLSRLRFRLVSGTQSREELDQLVLTSFLTTLHEVPQELDRLPMRLRQRTERQVFAFLRKEREAQRPSAALTDLAMFGSELCQQRRSHDGEEHLVELARLLDRAVAKGVAASNLEVVEATVLGLEPLRSYVERLIPEDADEQARTYQRLKRQRSRTLRRLKSLLVVSPVAAAAGF